MEALASISDETATAAFLARDPGHALPPKIDLIKPLAALDRTAAEQLVTRLAPPAVLGYGLIDALVKAGFSDRVAEIVRAIPAGDDDDLIRLVRDLHAHGFDEEVRRLLGPGAPIPRHPDQAAALLSVLDDLGDSAGVSALIDIINEDERLASRFWWFPNMLESLPVRVRDRLVLREPAAAIDAPGGTTRRPIKVYLTVEDEAADRAEALRALSRAELDQHIANADLTNLDSSAVVIR